MEQSNPNKEKKLFISVLIVLILVIAVIGISYAMFSFSATGTQENAIKSGYVTISFDNVSEINLASAYPIDDELVTEVTSGTGVINTMQFDVVSSSEGRIILDYDLGISDITTGTTLTSSYIKFRLKKSTDNGNTWSYVLGSSSSGVTLASRASSAGTYNLISTYAIDSAEIIPPTTVKYKLTAWIDSSWTMTTNAATGTCSDSTYTTVSDCYNAGEIWTQSQGTSSETFKFSVSVSATQSQADFS